MATFKFDKGPTGSWAQKFFDAPRQHYVTHPSGRFRTQFGPVYYRGRREDLAFGLPEWHGTGASTRSQRNGDKIINWTSPL